MKLAAKYTGLFTACSIQLFTPVTSAVYYGYGNAGNLPSFKQFTTALCFYGNSITLPCRIRLRRVLPVKFAQFARYGNLASFTQHTTPVCFYGNSITIHCRVRPLLTACSVPCFTVTLLRLSKCGNPNPKLGDNAICRRLLRNKLLHYAFTGIH